MTALLGSLLVVTIILFSSISCMNIKSDKLASLPYRPRDIVTPKCRYEIGAYKPQKGEYNFRCFDMNVTKSFLVSIAPKYKKGDIVSVDGLKWIRLEVTSVQRQLPVGWEPYPNPPMPVMKLGGDQAKHCIAYAQWVNDHPHFGYPPIPLFGKR